MAADNIREIFRTDTVGEFMDKCNWNFGIISRIGGPRGLQGERGETGARGRRGAMIHTVNEPDEMMDYMNVETANEILSTLDVEETENMEDGDVVFFKNGWVCEIGIEDGEIVAREPVFPIIGPQGPQGEQGESTDSLFSTDGTNLSGNALLLNHLSLTVGNRIYLPTMGTFDGGLYFASMTDGGNNNITIDAEKAFINFNQNTLNINSNSGINIGTTSSNSQINFSINNGDIMKVENDGLKLYKKIEFMGSANTIGEIVKGSNRISINDIGTIFNNIIGVRTENESFAGVFGNKSIIFSNNGSSIFGMGGGMSCNNDNSLDLGLHHLQPQLRNIIKITKDYNTFEKPVYLSSGSPLYITNKSFPSIPTSDNYYGKFYFNNSNYIVTDFLKKGENTPKNRTLTKLDVTTFYKPIELTAAGVYDTINVLNTAKIEYKYNQSDGSYLNIDKPVKAIVNGESVFLGVPAYTITPYPSSLDAPTGWERFDDNILMSVDDTSSIYAFEILYNGSPYHISAVSRLNDENFADYTSPQSEENRIGIGTPKEKESTTNSTSEVLELLGVIALQSNSLEQTLTLISGLGDFEDKGGTKPEYIEYENLMKKISANNKDMKDIFTAITDSDDTIIAFAYPKPKAPTGFTYIFKTA